jgi:hypothetical protein
VVSRHALPGGTGSRLRRGRRSPRTLSFSNRSPRGRSPGIDAHRRGRRTDDRKRGVARGAASRAQLDDAGIVAGARGRRRRVSRDGSRRSARDHRGLSVVRGMGTRHDACDPRTSDRHRTSRCRRRHARRMGEAARPRPSSGIVSEIPTPSKRIPPTRLSVDPRPRTPARRVARPRNAREEFRGTTRRDSRRRTARAPITGSPSTTTALCGRALPASRSRGWTRWTAAYPSAPRRGKPIELNALWLDALQYGV